MLRRRFSVLRALATALPLVIAGCNADFDDPIGPPEDPGPPTGPSQPPPTGSKWQGVEVSGACGRVKLAYVLIDEVCGGTDDPAYMEYFHAPIMRDGVVIGNNLYSVDATSLWVLDVSDADEVERKALLAGFGQPMSVAAYNDQLLIAAGDEGLLLVDVTLPDAPVRASALELDGPALDVFVDGDRAYVATGHGGVAVVDMSTGELVLETTLLVPGFAAAVAAKEGVAYVAACDTFATIDVATGELLGQSWVENAYDESDILVAPAKDVTLVGNTAFVAAGRYGAVAVDVTDSRAPFVGGNCTEQFDEAFYASGVREKDGQLYVAGGEYGILPLDVTDPTVACSTTVEPDLPPPPEDDATCSQEPPWEVIPWVETWSPPDVPEEGRDPLQTFPTSARIYAFGDATRIGLRAIDIRKPSELDVKLGRYNEPRLTEGMAMQGDTILLTGKRGGLYRLAPEGNLVKTQDIPEAKLARAAAFLGDGRWVVGGLSPETAGGIVYVEGHEPLYTDLPIWAGGLAAKAATVYVPATSGVVGYDLDGTTTTFSTNREAHLPQSIAVGEDHLVVAAPEWTSGIRVDGGSSVSLDEIGAFNETNVYDVSEWRRALPRRVVMTGEVGIVEVASLGGTAGVTIHTADGPVSLALPSGDYLAATLDGERLYTIAVDRGRYRTQLVTVDLSGELPEIVSVYAFAGAGTAVVASNEHLYLADGDRGIRHFDVRSDAPVLTETFDLTQEETLP